MADAPVPSIPVPDADPESLMQATLAMKQNIEVLSGAHEKFHVPTQQSTVPNELALAISRSSGV